MCSRMRRTIRVLFLKPFSAQYESNRSNSSAGTTTETLKFAFMRRDLSGRNYYLKSAHFSTVFRNTMALIADLPDSAAISEAALFIVKRRS